MVGRHSRGELRQDVPLPPLGHYDARRAELGEFGGDLERADRAARHENTLAEVGKWPPVVVCGDRSRRAGETVESRNCWDAGRLESAAGHHYPFECLGHAGMADEPSAIASTEEFDPSVEPDARRQGECLRIAMQVGENVAVGRENQIAHVLKVAEGSEDPTGVRVHARPHAAVAFQARPLSAEHRPLLEDRRLESLRHQPPRRGQPARSGPDHRDASCHLRNCRTAPRRL